MKKIQNFIFYHNLIPLTGIFVFLWFGISSAAGTGLKKNSISPSVVQDNISAQSSVSSDGLDEASVQQMIDTTLKNMGIYTSSDGSNVISGDVYHFSKTKDYYLNIIQLSFGSRVGDAKYNSEADLNNDGIIDLVDLSLLTSESYTANDFRIQSIPGDPGSIGLYDSDNSLIIIFDKE